MPALEPHGPCLLRAAGLCGCSGGRCMCGAHTANVRPPWLAQTVEAVTAIVQEAQMEVYADAAVDEALAAGEGEG